GVIEACGDHALAARVDRAAESFPDASIRTGHQECFHRHSWYAASWDHRAVEHLVCDRRRDHVDEIGARLRIVAQELHELLLALGLLLALSLPELLAGSTLVLLDDLVADPVDERVLLRMDDTDADERGN